MTEEKFENLWNQIGNIAQDITNSCDGKVQFDKEKKNYVQYEYNKLREHCRNYLSDNSQSQGNLNRKSDHNGPLLDRHKVASCIAGAILSTRPMNICSKDEESNSILLYFANESLALFSALGIVKAFIRADITNNIRLDEKLKDDFLKSGFLFPEPVHSDYLPWLLFLLKESSDIGFNVLSFSNILFLLETYTFQELRIKKLEKGK